MSKRLPYAVEMDIIRTRMKKSLLETAEQFGISRQGVRNVMARHKHLVDEAKEKMEREAVEGIIADRGGRTETDGDN